MMALQTAMTLVVVATSAVPSTTSDDTLQQPSTTRRVLMTAVFGGRFLGGGAAPGHTLEQNATAWAAAHRDSITGVLPCCGCFSIGPR
jgi:hypothetical protein